MIGSRTPLRAAIYFKSRGVTPSAGRPGKPATGSATIAGMRTNFVERRAALGESDPSFGLRFWQAQAPKTRFDAAWQLIVHYARVKGLDVRQLRLQRSVEALQRRRG